MRTQTTKCKVDTPENHANVLEDIKREGGVDALRAELKRYEMVITQGKEEIDRLNDVIRGRDIIIDAYRKSNEIISDALDRIRNK